jgi:tetratricopeptide (TPR) repeat protein
MSNRKTCFVIMPYGGSDEAARKRYTGIFKTIITPAAEAAGYKAKRSDIENSPGNITHDIINDLASADMVIADLTSANPNVFFELGIRHAFRKSGTVHIIDVTHEIPFDIKNYRAIEYSTELADIPLAIEQIADAIRKREGSPEKSDNPVHDAITDLPMNIRSAGDSALKEQIEKLQDLSNTLEEKNIALQARLYELDPSEGYNETENYSIDNLFDEAEEIRLSTGENALLRLNAALEQGGEEAFIKTLRDVIKSPYLSVNDFMSIADTCREHQLPDHRRVVLEVASKGYPNNDQILLSLIDAYDDSPNKVYQNRGRILIENYLGISHSEQGLTIERSNKAKDAGFALLFNFYFRMGKHEWIEAIASAAKDFGLETAVILRNLARSYASQGKYQAAEEMYKYAVEMHPEDDTTYAFYGDFLDDLGRYDSAYETTEQGVLADPNDGNRFINLAIQILNRGYVRDADRKLVGPKDMKTRLKHAIPYFVKAMDISGQRHLNHIISLLARANAIHIIPKLQTGALSDEDYDATSLDFTLEQIESKVA